MQSQIPTIADLALEYGTINKEQHQHVNLAFNRKKGLRAGITFEAVLLELKMATSHQVGLLQLIQDYLVIRARGETFGRLAVEKGYASQADIDNALEHQRKEFKRAKIKRLIGDILVASGVMTEKQKNQVLKEQIILEKHGKRILSENEADTGSSAENKPGVLPVKNTVTDYEKQFLQVKSMDEAFGIIAIEKGYAARPDIVGAQRLQEKIFREQMKIPLIGEILVEQGIMTIDQHEQILDEQQRSLPEFHVEPSFQIEITSDGLEAYVHINKKAKTRPGLEEIRKVLKDLCVTHGVYPDAVIQGFIDSKKLSFSVARQDFTMELIKSRRVRYTFSPQGIDNKIKKKGAALAEQGLTEKGYLKKDVFGNTMNQPSMEGLVVRCAQGTRLSSDKTKVLALKTGFPSLSIEKKFYIHPVINVLEDADLRYGPIEPYASLNVSGIVTGAYPVKAGNLAANEIRGADIEAIGDVTVDIGITDSTVSAQGSIKARYIHNSTILAFGDIVVDFEIIDSTVICSGRVAAQKCRVLSSRISAKQGILVGGAGSDKTWPCTLVAGAEEHIVRLSEQIDGKIAIIRKDIDSLEEKRLLLEEKSRALFQKMVDLKLFYDSARKKKEKIARAFESTGESLSEKKKKNMISLGLNFEKQMSSAKATIKDLNVQKKTVDAKEKKIKARIEALWQQVQNKISRLERDRFAYIEWARKNSSESQIHVTGKVHQGTVFKGIFAAARTTESFGSISVFERQKRHSDEIVHEMIIQPNR